MLDASKASYIITPEIKSPMGANLSALSTVEKAKELQKIHNGELHSWNSLKQRLSDK
jgi:copper chaperone NosL